MALCVALVAVSFAAAFGPVSPGFTLEIEPMTVVAHVNEKIFGLCVSGSCMGSSYGTPLNAHSHVK
jgi:hypothetical protein